MTQISETKDAVQGSWVYRMAPASWRPYLKLARMDRPVGTWLLLWPCWWSLLLAGLGAESVVSLPRLLALLALFAVGALAMRGAGCSYNDIIDKDFDGKVDRTKSRPIPAGEISLPQAWVFLLALCAIGLLVLTAFLNSTVLTLAAASLFLVGLYPFMKRITYWPQAWLGLTFNWGALMGWAAITDDIGWPAIILYGGGVFWTLGYDTIYAHQDSEDDALIGVKSTALALGDKTKIFVSIFYTLFIIALIATGIVAKLGLFYYIGLLFAAGHLFLQVKKLVISDSANCLMIFRSNISFGWIVCGAVIAGHVIG